MPLTARNSAGRRRKKPGEKLPEPPGESTSAQVMAPTRMKLRVRRRDAAGAGAGPGPGPGAVGGGQPAEEEVRRRESSSSSRRKNSSNAPTAAATTSSPPNSSPPTSSASARAVVAAEDASPDSKCPICLDRFNNLAYLDRCLHRFCFPCIQEWSHNKAECPLCKQPFASILHSVRAEDDFKEYTLRPAPANSSVAATVAMVAAMASAARSNHQMRLMLRRHRTADGLETTTRRRRRERGGRGGGSRRTGVWEWYLDSPPLPLPPLPHHPAVSPVVAEDSGEGEDLDQQRMRGGADLAERGVIFEGLTGLGGARTHNDRASRRLMTRLATRQRLQRDGGTVRRLRERETVAFRRALYRCSIRVRGVAGVSGNQGQQCDITADSFRRNPVHLNKLRPWLRRELTVLYGAHGTLVDIVQRIIMAQLARHGLEDSPTIEDELRPFLLARTDHFLHELVNFARSPLSLENYDLQAVYEPPAAALELDGISSPSDSSSVIAISEGEENEAGAGAHDDVIQTGSCLSLSGWDDETPGPSYSTAEPSCSLASLSFSPAQQEAANQEGEKLEGEEECLIVGYKKPIAERTPELVQLSSDTEEEEEKEKMTEKLPPPATTPPPLSYIPTIPPSTSATFQEEQDNKQKEKDGEAGGRCSRARSWSASSGRSPETVCTLSPSEGQQDSRRDWKQSSSETAREKRKRRKRGPDRSGTLCNPNRSIYPAMMCHPSHSPSPFHSSVESSSPPGSSCEYRCSPLTSSASSPSHSSSPFCFSPLLSSPLPQTPPSLSPGDAHHRDKPGGKRKYKSRHLDSNDKDLTWNPYSGHPDEKQRERRRKRGRDGGRRRDTHRRESVGSESISKRYREDRSPSVEIIYEGTILADATQPPARKRRRKRHRKTRHSSSPVIITLDSDTSHENDGNNKPGGGGSSSSSPLSSQQTVDFSDLPPLPLVHSAGVGGALDEEIGELPVDILDRGSDGSEAEPPGRSEAAGPVAVDNNSDHDVDVENVEESGSLLAGGPQPTGDNDFIPITTDLRKRNSAVSTSDTRLLATILDDLKGIAAPKCDLSLTFEPSHSPDSRKKRFQDLHEARSKLSSRLAEPRVPDVTDLPPCRKSTAPLPPLQQMDFRVGEDGVDVPPLLRQASPVRAHNRNTPPPLKHKDAGSPHLSPADRLSPHSSADRHSNPAADSRLAPEAFPPNSALKKHFKSTLALRGVVAPDSRSAALTTSIKHTSPVDSSSASENGSTHTDGLPHLDVMNSFHSSEEHSSCDVTEETSLSVRRSSPVHVDPVNSVDFHSAVSGWSKEKLPHTHSTSGGDQTFRPSSCRVVPADLHVSSSGVAGGLPAGSGVFSGVNSNDTSPLLLSTVDSRTPNHSSPVRSLPVDVLRKSSKCTDPRSSCAAAERLTDTFSVVNREDTSPPVDFHCMNPSPATDGHFNHAASPTSHRKCLSEPSVESLSKHSTDLRHHNHFDPVDAHRDDRVTSSPHNQWNSNASADAHSDSVAL
ncbi:E3 ubiquitin-protein ligase Topors-like [Hippoglossus hippoglossus]|uniref:E3 ubiquitin-protein ligase Topors-like n=1 Tax=Hippoglossus hippoglossus TaxID=8267 RepID=UPI00148B7AF0|nr:E3 ubiquitin-protein ligase Topors-like [Hippoglossus hippoglossus]